MSCHATQFLHVVGGTCETPASTMLKSRLQEHPPRGPGWRSPGTTRLSLSAQVVISGLWHRAPRRAPHSVESLLETVSPSAPTPHSSSLSLSQGESTLAVIFHREREPQRSSVRGRDVGHRLVVCWDPAAGSLRTDSAQSSTSSHHQLAHGPGPLFLSGDRKQPTRQVTWTPLGRHTTRRIVGVESQPTTYP